MRFKTTKVVGRVLVTIAAVVALRFSFPPERATAPVGTTTTTRPLTGRAEVKGARSSTFVTPPVGAELAVEPRGVLATSAAERLTEEIREAFDSLSVEPLKFALAELLPALVKEDAFAAARLAESMAEPSLRGEVMHIVARLWGKKDPENALAWAGALKVDYEREAALADAGEDVAREDPAGALQWIARSLPADGPSAILENLAQRWAEKDFAAAQAWIAAVSAGVQREALVARLAYVRARDHPEVSVRLVVEEMQPGDAQNEALVSVLHQWAQRDFSSAAAWVDRFPESSLRKRSIAELNAIAKYRVRAAIEQ